MAGGMAISSIRERGLPVSNGCQAVSVIAPNCVMAGILSTAAFILGAEEGLELIREQAASKPASPPNMPDIKREGFHPMFPHKRFIPRSFWRHCC